MNSTLYSRMTAGRRIAAACGVGVLLVGATACGSNGNDTSNASTDTSNSGLQTTQGNAGQFPGATGKIAAVDGSTAQVQSQQDGQVAVTWTAGTTFTKQVSAKLADIKVGDCVMATPAQGGTSSSTDDTTVAAASVRIISTSGDCSTGFGGPGGGQRPNFNGTAPSGGPSGAPSGGPTNVPGGGQFRGSFGAAGKVTAVSGSGFTVASTRPSTAGSGSTDTTTTSVAVTTSSSTTYATNARASASDVKVGGCLVAQGTTDDTGAVTAKTVALSAAVDGDCTGGFFRSRSSGAGTDAGTTGQVS